MSESTQHATHPSPTATTRAPHGFEAVDTEADSSWCARCLTGQAGQPFHQEVTRQVFAALRVRPGMAILDVGCGLGGDAGALARLIGRGGRVVGLDPSETLLAEAQSRLSGELLPAEFVQGDASALPFADAAFDGAYAIRVFQHLAAPEAAFAEMVRVLRPGGRLAIADPDHETTILDVSERDLARRFLTWRAATLRSGWIARHIAALARPHGLIEITITPLTKVDTDYEGTNALMGYEGAVPLAVADGALTPDEGERLIASLHAARDSSTFLAATTHFLTSATKA